MGRTAFREPQCLYKGDFYLYFVLLNVYVSTQQSLYLFAMLTQQCCTESRNTCLNNNNKIK